jgi:uncharacterized membrane protein YfcA
VRRVTPTDPWVLVLVGLGVATIAASVGLGGGLLIVPYLTLVAGFSRPLAVATSLVSVGVSALSACGGFARQRRIDWAAAAVFALGAVPGSILGAMGTARVTPRLFDLAMAGLLATVAVWTVAQPRSEAERRRTVRPGFLVLSRTYSGPDGAQVPYGVDLRWGLPASIVAGALGGFFGVGGGILMVPVMYLGLGMPFRIAAPTSSAVMVPMTVAAIGAHTTSDAAPGTAALWLAAGALVGGLLAARLTARLSGYVLRWMMAVLMVGVAASMAWRHFSGQ